MRKFQLVEKYNEVRRDEDTVRETFIKGAQLAGEQDLDHVFNEYLDELETVYSITDYTMFDFFVAGYFHCKEE